MNCNPHIVRFMRTCRDQTEFRVMLMRLDDPQMVRVGQACKDLLEAELSLSMPVFVPDPLPQLSITHYLELALSRTADKAACATPPNHEVIGPLSDDDS